MAYVSVRQELSADNPYFSFAQYTKLRFGTAAGKCSIDTGFGCVHQRTRGGCSYCNIASFTPAYVAPTLSVDEQWTRGTAPGHYPRYYAYFQLGTNTGPDAPISRFIEPLLQKNNIAGIMIGTRPDCLDDATLHYLSVRGRDIELWLEMGMQSANNRILDGVNRGHTFEDFARMAHRIDHAGNILLSAHVVFGLPGETETEMLSGVEALSHLPVSGVKFHHLAVTEGTKLAEQYRISPFPLFDETSYASIVARALALLPPPVVVARLMGDSHEKYLIAPRWKKEKQGVLAMIRAACAEQGLWQGKQYRV
ncbi:MAG: TIGR01212 family radical SAM protein [Spirochaetes bacterium]|nr:TIGR01212 family radical SAM protein [Spirochaetota bacterium]